MNDFTIKLGSLTNGKNKFSFEIKDQFFEDFTFHELKYADISAIALLEKDGEKISLNIAIKGMLNRLSCDICTEELSMPISAETDLVIKKTYEDLCSNDDILYIKKNESNIEIKHLIFELIVLNIPKKRQHDLNKNQQRNCNKKMIDLVNKYTQTNKQSSDPRWDELKKIKLK